MKENKLKNTIEEINLDYKKEKTKIILLNVFCIALVLAFVLLVNHSLMIIALSFFLIALLNYFLINQYDAKRRNLIKNRNDQFIQAINYFQIYLKNKYNVYQSFYKLKEYVSPWMQNKIDQLLLEIDKDKSIQPFIKFANHFTLKIASNIMISIYQMVDEGFSSEQLNHFTILFSQTSQNMKLEKRKNKEKSFDFALTLPTISAGIITMILALTIISVMGEMINVL